jgi:hypothetical protein
MPQAKGFKNKLVIRWRFILFLVLDKFTISCRGGTLSALGVRVYLFGWNIRQGKGTTG